MSESDNNGQQSAEGWFEFQSFQKRKITISKFEANPDDLKLLEYCGSEHLSLEGLREIITERYGFPPNIDNLYNYDFFRKACGNERVTEEIINFLLECFPDAANFDYDSSALHCACRNSNMTLNIIKILIDADPLSVELFDGDNNLPLQCLCEKNNMDEETEIEILELLIEKYPEAVEEVRIPHLDEDLPIHIASRTKFPEFCRLLIEAYPGSERIPNFGGLLPLHFACLEGSLATVEYLYGLYPDAITIAGVHHTIYATAGKYPIHAAISCTQRADPAAAVEIVKFLLECNPDQKLIQFEGKSLLHFACVMGYDDSSIGAGIQIIKILFDAHPASVHSVDSGGNMPLHSLCASDNDVGESEMAAIEILKFLLDKHPEAVRHADNNGLLPIHIASMSKSPEFCRVLIQVYPGSERIADAQDTLPFHFACISGSLAAVEYLYELYPDAIDATIDGKYPIHAALVGIQHRNDPAAAVAITQFLLDCAPDQKLKPSLLRYACHPRYDDLNIGAGIQLIKILFDAHPEAIKDNRIAEDINLYHLQVQAFVNSVLVYARQAADRRLMMTPDDNGQLPLHRALQNNARLGSIKLLVEGNPSAIRNGDINSAIPLHIACQHHGSASIVQYLLSLDEATLNATDRRGNTTLHYACRGAKHDTIALLLEKYDAASVSKRNADGKLPIELLWESNEVSDRESAEYTGSIFKLVQAYPETASISNLTMEERVDVEATRHGKKRKLNNSLFNM